MTVPSVAKVPKKDGKENSYTDLQELPHDKKNLLEKP